MFFVCPCTIVSWPILPQKDDIVGVFVSRIVLYARLVCSLELVVVARDSSWLVGES